MAAALTYSTTDDDGQKKSVTIVTKGEGRTITSVLLLQQASRTETKAITPSGVSLTIVDRFEDGQELVGHKDEVKRADGYVARYVTQLSAGALIGQKLELVSPSGEIVKKRFI